MREKLEELLTYVEELWEAENMEEMQTFYAGLLARINEMLKDLAKDN